MKSFERGLVKSSTSWIISSSCSSIRVASIDENKNGHRKITMTHTQTTYTRAKAGPPARIYIKQLCEDTGCSPEDLPEAMNDREKRQERVRDIHASGTTWWWWWLDYKITSVFWNTIYNQLKNHDQKSSEHLRMTYRNTGVLFWPY